VEVSAARAGDRVRLTVRDDGTGPAPARPDPDKGGGIGLRNTEERLRQMYGHGQHLSVEPAPGGGTLAVVEVPYREGAEERAAALAEEPVVHER
jgi:two-component system sensor histidine kinase YesM